MDDLLGKTTHDIYNRKRKCGFINQSITDFISCSDVKKKNIDAILGMSDSENQQLVNVINDIKGSATQLSMIEPAKPDSLYKPNLRFTISDVMTRLFGFYREDDISKMASIIGISLESLTDLVHNGIVNQEDFSLICAYLKPAQELKERWYRFYVINNSDN